ncbi:glycosyltransferase family 2 protein [Methanothermococcus sp. Ax23]|uniref:glycosyltransferase family 2 protein n=1 Tax=Methanothermococcus sp. Ax23 TaxID=3156486 RepID=UPI003B9E6056
MKKETTCAVVVTYNRKDLLIECLDALRKQTKPIDAIYLIDNASTDGTSQLLLEKEHIKELPPENLNEPWEKTFTIKNLVNGENIKLHYVRMHENTGGAGGFYEGVKRAYEKGYDWLWLMDDDAEPKEDALEKLSEYFNEKDVSALACVVNDVKEEVSIFHRGYFDFDNIFPLIQKPIPLEKYFNNKVLNIDFASFVGILVSKKAISKMGYPKKEFFIHHDDVEYCIRLRKVSKILLITDSIIFHKEMSQKNVKKKKFLWKIVNSIPYEKLWLSYYGCRNLTWLGKKYSTNKLKFYTKLTTSYLKSILGILLFNDNKIKRIKFITNAYLDGLKGNFDNEKPRRILYD